MAWDHFKGWDNSGTAKATTMPEFNPSENRHVTEIKATIETLIAYLRNMQDGNIGQDESTGPAPQDHPDPRCVSIAITKLEEASMWAVKSLFVK